MWGGSLWHVSLNYLHPLLWTCKSLFVNGFKHVSTKLVRLMPRNDQNVRSGQDTFDHKQINELQTTEKHSHSRCLTQNNWWSRIKQPSRRIMLIWTAFGNPLFDKWKNITNVYSTQTRTLRSKKTIRCTFFPRNNRTVPEGSNDAGQLMRETHLCRRQRHESVFNPTFGTKGLEITRSEKVEKPNHQIG